jgi:hypothetical protein
VNKKPVLGVYLATTRQTADGDYLGTTYRMVVGPFDSWLMARGQCDKYSMQPHFDRRSHFVQVYQLEKVETLLLEDYPAELEALLAQEQERITHDAYYEALAAYYQAEANALQYNNFNPFAMAYTDERYFPARQLAYEARVVACQKKAHYDRAQALVWTPTLSPYQLRTVHARLILD